VIRTSKSPLTSIFGGIDQRRFAPYVAFLLSGASSLVFQTIWTRMLHHVFGATSVAISTVLTVFMAGLGLGAWISGRVADRIKHPIFAYAIAEIAIAAWGLIIPFLVDSEGFLATVNAFLRQELGAESGTFMIARFLCVVPILLVPTTLMGTSLPLLAQHFARREKDPNLVGAYVGTLYSVNTFGAACGPILSAFILMPTVGLAITNVVACSLNLTLAALIFVFRKPLIGSAWGSGEKISIWPSKEKVEEVEAVPMPVTSPASADTDDAPALETKSGSSKKRGRVSAKSEREPVIDAPPQTATQDDIWIPPIARKMAFIAFALSGASALCYEVVWSRALAMTIGSSIYSFALILETFLIGIATGAAAMSALMGRGHTPLRGIAIAAGALTLLAMAPWAIDIQVGEGRTHHGDLGSFFLVSAFPIVIITLVAIYAARSATRTEALAKQGGVDARTVGDTLTPPSLVILLVPLTCAVLNAGYFSAGYLPKILASVVASIAIILGTAITLRRHPVLLLALIQLLIAGATTVSYIWQDEIPYAFAQLVVSIGDLPSHVGTVQFFMFFTAALCTLPATLGMGAMFPLTVRVWTAGGSGVARDVAVVYTGNTIGSIVGSWLPGFVLLPLIGMERTLHVGIALNMLLALGMLIAGAAEPASAPTTSTPRKVEKNTPIGWIVTGVFFAAAASSALFASYSSGDVEVQRAVWLGIGAIGFLILALGVLLRASGKDHRDQEAPSSHELPTWHAVLVYVLSPAIPALLALLYLGTAHPDSLLRWNLTQMTLGVFRVSLAEGMLDPQSWGQPDLVYYQDGLSTTVSVERWGRHYALKNNGKVDASNGDDMPTQITVAAYPLLMHQDGPQDLDVAVVGFGSGVSVGTTMSFPVRSVDVIELERAVPEAARFFQDVNLLDYNLDTFPYVEMDRLQIIGDDGRNYLASTDRQYDVIISEPSNPWITGVSDLFTTDHFRITKQRLRPGGIYCQWVQLYELSPENIKTIYRTFAEQYRYVIVLAADDQSSDTVMLGSDAPLTLDAERLARVWQTPAVHGLMSVHDQLERADLHSPFDVFARILLSSKEEVLSYAQIERRLRGGTWHADAASANGGTCAAPNCVREPVVLNTDDNARIEFAAPRDLIGFERYEGYLGTIYSPEWPYGRFEDALRGIGEGDERARNLAELAMSLIGHGRYEVAAHFIELSQAAGRARETAIAVEVLTHLLSGDHEPAMRIEEPVPGPEMERASAEQFVRGFERVRTAMSRTQWATALGAMEDIPAPLRLHSGPATRALYGYLLYKAADGAFAQYRAAAEQFEDLVRTDENYVATHPEIFYFLARSKDSEGKYGEALRYMRRYIEARLTISPSDAAQLAEPPNGEAVATDATGVSEKTDHADRE
jgi:spermidine synthase